MIKKAVGACSRRFHANKIIFRFLGKPLDKHRNACYNTFVILRQQVTVKVETPSCRGERIMNKGFGFLDGILFSEAVRLLRERDFLFEILTEVEPNAQSEDFGTEDCARSRTR